MKEADLGGSAGLLVPAFLILYLSLPYSDEGEWQSMVQLRSRSSYLMERIMIKLFCSYLGCGKSLSCRAIAPDVVVDLLCP
jgi:hypothetical protein